MGSVAPVPCPPGTNSSLTRLTQVSSCGLCTGGYYCPLSASVHATRKCPAGDFCPPGTSEIGYDNICPTGYKCPYGSVYPEACPAGYYQDEVGQHLCKVSDNISE